MIKHLSKSLVYAAAAIAMAFVAFSCTQEKAGENFGNADIDGLVIDTDGAALSDVTVSVKGTDVATSTASDGSFSLTNVKITDPTVISFVKKGYAPVAMTLPVSWLKSGKATLNPVLEYAEAVISGRVLDGQNPTKPLAGVKVDIGTANVTTGEDGTYKFENLKLSDYTVSFSKSGALSYSKSYKKADFDENGQIVVPDVLIGGAEIFPGLTAQHLMDAPCWYSNEYRGGYNNGGGRVDWTCSFMSCQVQRWVGNWEMQNEGCTLRILNTDADKQNPADLEHFDTYIYGRKLITADNKILSIESRCHQGPCYWSVQIVDLSAANPVPVKVLSSNADADKGLDVTQGGDLETHEIDLSAYVGKEVIVSMGQHRIATGDYWHQWVLRHISFGPSKVNGDDYLSGTEVPGLPGWHMTLENVKSMMPNTHTEFIGYIPDGVDVKGKGNPAYKNLAGTGHIMSEWAFQYVNKDTEPLVGEGFVFKTRADIDANYETPESFWYVKLPISAANDKMTLRARNFDGTIPTCYKVIAITEDGTVETLKTTGESAINVNREVSGGNGCWEFIHENGGKDNPAGYGQFVYDLSKFNGKNVMICIAVFKGANRGGEQKICIHSVSLE